MDHNSNKIPVLQRAVEVMEYIANHPGRVSQPELIDALKIPQATCYRIIATLVAAKWLVKLPGNKYDIAPNIALLSRKTQLQLEKYRPLQPALEHLARQVGYSVKLAVIDGSEHVTVLSAKAPWDIALSAAPGTRFELKNGGSVAIILLSDMPQKMQNKIIEQAAAPAELRKLIDDFKRTGSALNPATADSPVEALSIAVKDKERIIGVLTLLSMPGELSGAPTEKLLEDMKKTARFCGEFMQ